VPITIKEVIRGSGEDWYSKDIIDRDDWLRDHLPKDSYRVWYGGTVSDERYTRFENNEDLLAYRITWPTT